MPHVLVYEGSGMRDGCTFQPLWVGPWASSPGLEDGLLSTLDQEFRSGAQGLHEDQETSACTVSTLFLRT